MTERERHFAAHEELEVWMRAHKVSERDVLAWLRGPSLWTYVTKRLQGLLRGKGRGA